MRGFAGIWERVLARRESVFFFSRVQQLAPAGVPEVVHSVLAAVSSAVPLHCRCTRFTLNRVMLWWCSWEGPRELGCDACYGTSCHGISLGTAFPLLLATSSASQFWPLTFACLAGLRAWSAVGSNCLLWVLHCRLGAGKALCACAVGRPRATRAP